MFLYQNLANPFLGEFEHRVSNVQKGISNETSWCPGRPVGPVVTRKVNRRTHKEQRTHMFVGYTRREVCAKDISYRRERERDREESTSVKIAGNNTMSASRGCRYVPTRSGNRAVWRTWLGLSIKETGAGNRALYSQHKPPMQKRIERGQER